MSYNKPIIKQEASSVSLGRHKSQCSICLHPQCSEIEDAFVDWASTTFIGDRYQVSRDAQYRHARALGLFDKRQANIKMALERIIERGDYAHPTVSGVVSAIQAYTNMNSADQAKDQALGTNPKELFERMSAEERACFARDGSLPEWFSRAEGATPGDSQDGENSD